MFGLDQGSESNRDQEEKSGEKGNTWQQIGNIAKYFNISFEDILWKHSWANLMMYSLSIPKNKKKKDDDIVGDINLSNPNDLSKMLG